MKNHCIYSILFLSALLIGCKVKPQAPETKENITLITVDYQCPVDYNKLLSHKTYTHSQDPFDKPLPSGSGIIGDIPPYQQLEKLGFVWEPNFTYSYSPSRNIFRITADIDGHDKIKKLHQKLNIPLNVYQNPKQ
jgi:hypothetical protein